MHTRKEEKIIVKELKKQKELYKWKWNHTVNYKSNAQCDIVDLQMVYNGLI